MIKFTQADVMQAIKAVTIKMQALKELALEAPDAEDRGKYAIKYEGLAKRVEELQEQLKEMQNDTQD